MLHIFVMFKIQNIFTTQKFVTFDSEKSKKKTIKFLKKKNYCFIEDIGSGAFGDVIAIKRKTERKLFAAKIVHKDYVSPGERYLWPCLKPPNILSLLRVIHIK